MGKVLELTIPPDQFALQETFGTIPDAEFEAVPVAAHGPCGGMPFISASSSNPERLDDAIRADETTERVTIFSKDEGQSLYQISWQAQAQVVLDVFLQARGLVLSAHGVSDKWHMRLLFPTQAAVTNICEKWRKRGIEPSVQRVNSISGRLGHGGVELSKCQMESLVMAFELDYYDVPRGVSLDGLADELQVSHQALSERLRRGHRNLVRTTLCDSSTPIRNEPS